MKIINLKAENIKRLKAVDITPDGDVVVIAGKNGEGKSSVLDAIEMALRGKDFVPGKPIRDGQEKASVRLDLGKFVVERRFTASGTYLEVKAADGAKYPTPQAILDGLTASITFDPLEFARMDAPKQVEALRRLIKLDVDIDALDAANKADFDARTDVNRRAKAALAELNGMEAKLPPEAERPAAKVDVVALVGEVTKLKDQARADQVLRDRIANGETVIATTKNAAALAEKNAQERFDREEAEEKARREKWEADRKRIIDEEVERQKTAAAEVVRLENALKALKDEAAKPTPATPEAIAEAEAKLQGAEGVNRAFALVEEAIAKKAAYNALHAESEALTAKIDGRAKDRAAAIAAAKMPIDGLSLADGVVTFKGIPFDQASSAEQIRVSTAIAMAMNPELRVIRIKDGALLDDDSMSILRDMAKTGDFQIWIERVGDGEVGVIIEDGSVKP